MVALAVVPWGLASAFSQALALPGLKLNLRKEKQEAVAVCCFWYSADKTGHGGFLCLLMGTLRLSVPNLELKFTRAQHRGVSGSVLHPCLLASEETAFSCSCDTVTCPIPRGHLHTQSGACTDKSPQERWAGLPAHFAECPSPPQFRQLTGRGRVC